MKKENFMKYWATGMFVLMTAACLFGSPPRQNQFMNFQQLVIYHHRGTNEYFLAATATDEKTRIGNFDTMNVHVILKMNDGKEKFIDNEDLKIACLGTMYNKVIGQKTTLFRFNLLVDNSGSIDRESLGYVQRTLTKFIELIPLAFEAQVIKFSSHIQVKTKFTKDKQTLINAINQAHAQGSTALFDAMEVGVQELKYLGDEVPLRFSVVLTDGKNNASKRNPDTNTFKHKIVNECKKNFIPLFIVGVTNSVDSPLLNEMAGFGFYQHIQAFPDLDKAFEAILNVIKDTYIFKIPAVGNFSDLQVIYLVKKTPGGNKETIQDFNVH